MGTRLYGIHFQATSRVMQDHFTGHPTSWKSLTSAPSALHGVEFSTAPSPLQTTVAQLGNTQHAITHVTPPTAPLKRTTGSSTLDATIGAPVGVAKAVFNFVTAPIKFVADTAYLSIPEPLKSLTDLATRPDVKQTLSNATGGATDLVLTPLAHARQSSEEVVDGFRNFAKDPISAVGRAVDHVVDNTKNNPLKTIDDYSRFTQTVTTGLLFATPFLGWNVTKLPTAAAAPGTATRAPLLNGPSAPNPVAHVPAQLTGNPLPSIAAPTPIAFKGPFTPNLTGATTAGNVVATGLPSHPIALASGEGGLGATLNEMNLFGQRIKFDDKNGMHYPRDPGLPEQTTFQSLIDPSQTEFGKRAGYFPGLKALEERVSTRDLALYAGDTLSEASMGRRLVDGLGPDVSSGMDLHITSGTLDRVMAHPDDGRPGLYFQDAHVHLDGKGPSVADRIALAQQHLENQKVVSDVRMPIPVSAAKDADGQWIDIEYGPWHSVSPGDVQPVQWPGIVAPGYGAPIVQLRTRTSSLPSGEVSRQGVVRISGLSETVDAGRMQTYLKGLAAEHNLDALTIELDLGTSRGATATITRELFDEKQPFSQALKYDFTTGEDVYSVRKYDDKGKAIEPDPNTRLLTWQMKFGEVIPDAYGVAHVLNNQVNFGLGETIPLASDFKIIPKEDQKRAKALQDAHLEQEGFSKLLEDPTYWAAVNKDTVRVVQKPKAVAGESPASLAEATIKMLRQAKEQQVPVRDLELILPDGLPGFNTSALSAAELSNTFALTETGNTLTKHGFEIRHALPLPGVDNGHNLLIQLRIPEVIPPTTTASVATSPSPANWTWPTDGIERKVVTKNNNGAEISAHIVTLPSNAPLNMVKDLGTSLVRHLEGQPDIGQVSLYVPLQGELGQHLKTAFDANKNLEEILTQRFENDTDNLISLNHQFQPLSEAEWYVTGAKRVSDSKGNPGYSVQFKRAQATQASATSAPTMSSKQATEVIPPEHTAATSAESDLPQSATRPTSSESQKNGPIAINIWPTNKFQLDKSPNKATLWAGHRATINETISLLKEQLNQIVDDGAIRFVNLNFSLGSSVGAAIEAKQNKGGGFNIKSVLKISGQGNLKDTSLGTLIFPLIERDWKIKISEIPSLNADRTTGFQIALDRGKSRTPSDITKVPAAGRAPAAFAQLDASTPKLPFNYEDAKTPFRKDRVGTINEKTVFDHLLAGVFSNSAGGTKTLKIVVDPRSNVKDIGSSLNQLLFMAISRGSHQYGINRVEVTIPTSSPAYNELFNLSALNPFSDTALGQGISTLNHKGWTVTNAEHSPITNNALVVTIESPSQLKQSVTQQSTAPKQAGGAPFNASTFVRDALQPALTPANAWSSFAPSVGGSSYKTFLRNSFDFNKNTHNVLFIPAGKAVSAAFYDNGRNLRVRLGPSDKGAESDLARNIATKAMESEHFRTMESLQLYLNPQSAFYGSVRQAVPNPDTRISHQRLSQPDPSILDSTVLGDAFKGWTLSGVERLYGGNVLKVELRPTPELRQQVKAKAAENARNAKWDWKSPNWIPGKVHQLDGGISVQRVGPGQDQFSRLDPNGKRITIGGRAGFDSEYVIAGRLDQKGRNRVARNNEGRDLALDVRSPLDRLNQEVLQKLELARDVSDQVGGIWKMDISVPVNSLPEPIRNYYNQLLSNPALSSQPDTHISEALFGTELGKLMKDAGFDYALLRAHDVAGMRDVATVHFVVRSQENRMDQLLKLYRRRLGLED